MHEDNNSVRSECGKKTQGVICDQTGDLFPEPDPRPTKEIADHERGRPERAPMSIYLWLRCEGWMRFGPFEWLRFDDQSQTILGSAGETVATKVDDRWRVPGEKCSGWQFSDPMITTTSEHPHPNSGSQPIRRH